MILKFSIVLNHIISAMVVITNDMPNQRTTATLSGKKSSAFLKVTIPIARKLMPMMLTGQSFIPLDSFRQTFHTASQTAEAKRKSIPVFIDNLIPCLYSLLRLYRITADRYFAIKHIRTYHQQHPDQCRHPTAQRVAVCNA